jgi:hypothetical protein
MMTLAYHCFYLFFYGLQCGKDHNFKILWSSLQQNYKCWHRRIVTIVIYFLFADPVTLSLARCWHCTPFYLLFILWRIIPPWSSYHLISQIGNVGTNILFYLLFIPRFAVCGGSYLRDPLTTLSAPTLYSMCFYSMVSRSPSSSYYPIIFDIGILFFLLFSLLSAVCWGSSLRDPLTILSARLVVLAPTDSSTCYLFHGLQCVEDHTSVILWPSYQHRHSILCVFILWFSDHLHHLISQLFLTLEYCSTCYLF